MRPSGDLGAPAIKAARDLVQTSPCSGCQHVASSGPGPCEAREGRPAGRREASAGHRPGHAAGGRAGGQPAEA